MSSGNRSPPSRGHLHPVYCAADLSAEAGPLSQSLPDTLTVVTRDELKGYGRFIAVNEDCLAEPLRDYSVNEELVFVDSLTEAYVEPPAWPVMDPSSATSPFKGKTPLECYFLSRELRQNTASDIDYTIFAIMNERSMEDQTVLLNKADDEGCMSVRVPFEKASLLLMNLVVAKVDIPELARRADDTRDGVLR